MMRTIGKSLFRNWLMPIADSATNDQKPKADTRDPMRLQSRANSLTPTPNSYPIPDIRFDPTCADTLIDK
jgi:hypothetical protein